MNDKIRSPIRHMLQGLAHWMAYRYEMSNIQLIEADAVFVATDILRANLPKDYKVEIEITKKTLSIVAGERIDLGIKSEESSYECLIEFKLADATNKGYEGDVNKLSQIKQQEEKIDCLVVILYRKPCFYNEPEEFIAKSGIASRKIIEVGNNKALVNVRCICNSFTSSTNPKSIKTICLELL